GVRACVAALPGVDVGGGGGAADGSDASPAGRTDVGVERAGERDGSGAGCAGSDPGAGAVEGGGGAQRFGAGGGAGEPDRVVESGTVRGGGVGEGGGVRAVCAAGVPVGWSGRWTRITFR